MYWKQLDDAVRRHINILIYVWTGTCDITTKRSNEELVVRSPHSKHTANKIIEQYRRAIDLIEPYGNDVQIKFLDYLTFLPSKWNSS